MAFIYDLLLTFVLMFTPGSCISVSLCCHYYIVSTNINMLL